MTTHPATTFPPRALSYRQRQLRAAAPFLAWGLYFVFFVLHALLRAVGDQIFPVHSVEGLERALTGRNSALWLQEQAYPSRMSPLDRLTTGAHLVWFAWPIIFGVAITIWRRDILVRYLSWVTLTWFTYDLLSLAFPVRPPWMVDGEVVRVLFTRGWIEYASSDPNPVAAFPSLHVGIPAVIGLFLLVHWPKARWLGYVSLGYALIVGFSVIYLGEHWLVDVLAALAVAWLIRLAFVSKRFHRAIDRVLPGKPAERLSRMERAATASMTGPAEAERSAAPDTVAEQQRAA